MAKVIDYYAAKAGGSSTMYYYRSPDNTSAATRIDSGSAIQLPADYASRMVGSMYPMRKPSGWIPWYHVDGITAVYKTVLDECTPPTALSLDAQAKVLTITGGDGGDLNAFTGFGISWRERSVNESVWGEWSEETVVDSRAVSVTATPGTVRQYRVRTQGEGGSEHFSDYVLCQDLLNGNTAAGTPVILLPLAGLSTCADVAAFLIDCPPEPDGDPMTLQRSVNNGEWTDVATLAPEGGKITDLLSLSGITHTVRYRLMDAIGAIGGEDSIAIDKAVFDWPREVEAGDVIANTQISFAQDIARFKQLLDRLRTFYGLNALTLPGAAGRFGDVISQFTAMQNAVDDCRAATGRSAYGFTELAGFPAAAQIAQLIQAIHET